jgi:hypothetical protein
MFLALARVFGLDLLAVPLLIVASLLWIVYLLVYVAAPLVVFTVVCVSSRLSFRHIPLVAAITLAGLLTVPYCLAVGTLLFTGNPLYLSSFLPDIALWVFWTTLWWGAQSFFIWCIYYIYQRRKRRPSLLQHACPPELRLPTTSRDSHPPE